MDCFGQLRGRRFAPPARRHGTPSQAQHLTDIQRDPGKRHVLRVKEKHPALAWGVLIMQVSDFVRVVKRFAAPDGAAFQNLAFRYRDLPPRLPPWFRNGDTAMEAREGARESRIHDCRAKVVPRNDHWLIDGDSGVGEQASKPGEDLAVIIGKRQVPGWVIMYKPDTTRLRVRQDVAGEHTRADTGEPNPSNRMPNDIERAAIGVRNQNEHAFLCAVRYLPADAGGIRRMLDDIRDPLHRARHNALNAHLC